jgi:hypothetical protein
VGYTRLLAFLSSKNIGIYLSATILFTLSSSAVTLIRRCIMRSSSIALLSPFFWSSGATVTATSANVPTPLQSRVLLRL